MLKVVDKNKCHDAEEAIYLMQELAKENIETDFDYTNGFWLVVTKVERR